ncbi:dihydrokaempferol 4-reductase [Umbelopsis sp. AD052]|nr:dihydrokaempferol 4-reductase [Umbelopsis sp. AD052]
MSSNTIQKGSHILVTGVTGFIATHVAKQLLKAGYRVTGTARNQAKADALKTALAEYGSDKFKVLITGDLEKEGAFDEAVKDVDAIAHTASPVTFTSEDPLRDVINPAVNGTISLLHSAQKYGKNVKHIVVTSSVVSVGSGNLDHPYTYTEKDWNDGAYEKVRHWKKGDPIDGSTTYAASKNQAERALWKFQQDESPKFTINTILPALNIGRLIPTPKSAAEVTGTPGMIAVYYSGKVDLKTAPDMPHVDVEDVALAHVRAIEIGSETNGERFILAAGTYDPQQIVDILRRHYPERKDIIPEGTPGNYKQHDQTFDGSKATQVLGIEYKSLETSLIELFDDVKQLY